LLAREENRRAPEKNGQDNEMDPGIYWFNMIFFTAQTPTVYTAVRDCGVLLTIRYLISPRSRRGSEQAIWEDILGAFSKCTDIDFAYPTQRFYDNVIEGKRDARADSDPSA
jgi:hypothetical protein